MVVFDFMQNWEKREIVDILGHHENSIHATTSQCAFGRPISLPLHRHSNENGPVERSLSNGGVTAMGEHTTISYDMY